MAAENRISDGQVNFAGGVDSGKNPTIATEADPTGLRRDQIAWANNATVRGGGVGCRTGFTKVELNFNGDTALQDAFELGLFQGSATYEPDNGFPYHIVSVSGRIFLVRIDTDNSVQEITIPGDPNTAMAPHAWFCQAEQFMVIQNGVDLPLFWDGATIRRSLGVPGQEIPVGTAMDYYMGRLWYANGRQYCAGDIVRGGSGTLPYNFRDAVLRTTENPVAVGGDGFWVPTNSGNITALKHTANLDTSLGEGQLFVFTRTNVYALSVPTTRAQWIAATDPLQRVAQVKYGATSQESVCHVNGDLFYRAPDGIRSLFMAIRDFSQWGNTPVSRNVNRVVSREDRALHRYASAIEFDNRIYQTCFPTATSQGAVFSGLLVLDFDIISSFWEKEPPAWEGMVNGLNFLQLLASDFGGVDRAFSYALQSGTIQLWEISSTERWDNVEGRIEWAIETPAYVFGSPFQLKRLDGLELWIDKLFGVVDFEVWYRPDQYPCWQFWHIWQECAVRNPCEDPDSPTCYVIQSYREQFKATVTLPQPPDGCARGSNRPFRFGHQFQIMIKVRGWARIRGLVLHASPVEKTLYENLVC